MCQPSLRKCKGRCSRYGGMSLVEMVAGLAIMSMMSAGLAALAITVSTAQQYNEGRADALQQCRVFRERVERSINNCHFSESFPGFVVVTATANGFNYPDCLVVWQPVAPPVDATGLPRVNEIVVFLPDPNKPASLLEISNRSATPDIVPTSTTRSAWNTILTNLIQSAGSTKLVLTDRLRTAVPVNAQASDTRGCVRFLTAMTPEESDLAAYRNGTKTWPSLTWPLDRYGNQMGLAGRTCNWELQLLPSRNANTGDILCLFDAVTFYQEIVR